MKEYIKERAVQIADYVIAHRCTVREAAAEFCVSKSTAHKDLSERLPEVDASRHAEASAILAMNWSDRYNRGGAATRYKYARVKSNKKMR